MLPASQGTVTQERGAKMRETCLQRYRFSQTNLFNCDHLTWSGCRLCSLPAKDARGNRDSAVPDLLCGLSKQQLAVLSERATQLLQLGGVSILLLFQVP